MIFSVICPQMKLLFILISISSTSGQFSFGEYSEKVARQALNIAASAYSSDPLSCIENTFPDKYYVVAANHEVVCDRKGNTCSVFAAISHVDKVIAISFRGTTSGKQLKLEMIESLKPDIDWYGFGLVDRYFYNALNSLWLASIFRPYLHPVLEQRLHSSYNVFFTGHSLGGALASLAVLKAYHDRLRDPALMNLHTFGAPRVGNHILANNIDRLVTNSWRIVHAGDIVPHLPPCKNSKNHGCDETAHRRAYHHGTEVWYPKGMAYDSDYRVCTADDEDASCSNSLGKYRIHDHYYYFEKMVSYYGKAGCPVDWEEPSGTGILSVFSSFIVLLISLLW